MSTTPWVTHDGSGAPLPAGTLVQILRFNGDVDTFHIGAGKIVAADGAQMRDGNARWSCWNHGDGGPRAVKAKCYRVLAEVGAHARNAAMFREWLRTSLAADEREFA